MRLSWGPDSGKGDALRSGAAHAGQLPTQIAVACRQAAYLREAVTGLGLPPGGVDGVAAWPWWGSRPLGKQRGVWQVRGPGRLH